MSFCSRKFSKKIFEKSILFSKCVISQILKLVSSITVVSKQTMLLPCFWLNWKTDINFIIYKKTEKKLVMLVWTLKKNSTKIFILKNLFLFFNVYESEIKNKTNSNQIFHLLFMMNINIGKDHSKSSENDLFFKMFNLFSK